MAGGSYALHALGDGGSEEVVLAAEQVAGDPEGQDVFREVLHEPLEVAVVAVVVQDVS
jgi:hypothetical protein